MHNMFKTVLLSSFLAIGINQSAYAADDKAVEDYMPSLITKTPL